MVVADMASLRWRSEMRFETSSMTETGLQMIDEALLEAFRFRFEETLLSKWNPRWSFRKVTILQDRHKRISLGFSVRVEGLARIHSSNPSRSMRWAHVDAVARVARSRGCSFPISVSGTYADDRPSMLYIPPRYSFEKNEFPKDW